MVRNNIALMYYQLGDLDHANELALAASAIWNRIGAGDRAGVAETTLGIDYLELGDYRNALKFLQEALYQFRVQMGYSFGVAESWNDLLLVYSAQGAYGRGGSCPAKSIALTRKINNADLEAEALANLGTVQFQAGKPAAAIASLKASLALNERFDEKLKIASAACTLGCVYLSQKKFDEASIYCGEVSKRSNKIHDGLEKGKTLVALAELERKRGRLDQSLDFASQAVQAWETRPGNPRCSGWLSPNWVEPRKHPRTQYGEHGIQQRYRRARRSAHARCGR